MNLVFNPNSGTELPNHWNFLSDGRDKGGMLVMWVSECANMITRGKQWCNRVTKGYNFHPYPMPNFWGADWVQWFNQSCLCNKASIKIQKAGLEEIYLVNTSRYRESVMHREHGGSVPHTLPYAFLPCGYSRVVSFYNELVTC